MWTFTMPTAHFSTDPHANDSFKMLFWGNFKIMNKQKTFHSNGQYTGFVLIISPKDFFKLTHLFKIKDYQ
jgi:hypothetical protein